MWRHNAASTSNWPTTPLHRTAVVSESSLWYATDEVVVLVAGDHMCGRQVVVRVLALAALALCGFSIRLRAPFAGPQTKVGTRPNAARRVDFLQDVQPIFEQNCYKCHGPNAQLSGLRLDLKQSALAGGSVGKDILPGKAYESALYGRVAGLGGVNRMPMGGKPLPDDQIELIRLWIDQGADWPETDAAKPGEVKKHWASVPAKRPRQPPLRHPPWPNDPVDPCVLAPL